ncbi:hypothetical protein DL764_010026 [Monosporascus ibericus]|uniref:Uncharacterized protein n=1 Tax=Monosporascus ibericus TaxID=155417 RepID=A0A4Q4SVF4_9PEZI|nr:hypothetical protein DL764_010026 [Monosporascus ibericus]
MRIGPKTTPKSYLRRLKDDEIKASYALPPKRVLNGDAGDNNEADPGLVRIFVAAEAMLKDAYELCNDTSPGRRITQ